MITLSVLIGFYYIECFTVLCCTLQEEIQKVIAEVKEKHPALDVKSEDVIEKGWTKRQSQATKQYLKKMDAVSKDILCMETLNVITTLFPIKIH